jgi:pyridoxamine 5'-phosphate oxidase
MPLRFVDPYRTLSAWMEEATATEPRVPDAVQLATAGADGRPSIRTVLLKQWGAELGLVFFTSYDSRKGKQLAENPHAALCLHMKGAARQVIAEGSVVRLDPTASDAYFAMRPRGSQLGAWASVQSAPVASREALLADVAEVEARYAGKPVPRPPNWGGFRLIPERFEFWIDGHDRLHDRFEVVRDGEAWRGQRLCP